MSTTNQKLIDGIKEEILKLPKESQEVINSFDWIKITDEIGRKYNYTEDEINDLQLETSLALVGLVDADLFTTNVEDEVGTTKIEAEKISAEIFEKIFKPIADKIEEKIKNNLANKKINWDQNLNFVLAGGDYSVFAEKSGITNTLVEPARVIPVYPFSSKEVVPKIDNAKSDFVI